MSGSRSPRERETHEIDFTIEERAAICLIETLSARHEACLGPRIFHQANGFKEVRMKEGLAPSLQNNGLHIAEIGDELFEVIQGHVR